MTTDWMILWGVALGIALIEIAYTASVSPATRQTYLSLGGWRWDHPIWYAFLVFGAYFTVLTLVSEFTNLASDVAEKRYGVAAILALARFLWTKKRPEAGT